MLCALYRIKQPSSPIIIISLLLVLLLSCSQLEPDAGSQLSGYVNFKSTQSRWPNPESIAFCWEPVFETPRQPHAIAATPENLASISEILQREFLRAGIHLIKQGTCEKDSQGIRVQIVYEGTDETRAIGFGLNGKKAGMQLNWAKRCTKDAAVWPCLVNTALHEFGHALGLHHEMNRRDQHSCSKDQTKGQGETWALAIGVYNPDSIMSYCRDRQLMQVSEADIRTLHDYYYRSFAEIWGQPASQSSTDQIVLGIGGQKIQHYRWQLSLEADRCLDEAAYSSIQARHEPLWADLSGLAREQRVFICVLGRAEGGDWQALDSFSSISWWRS